MGRLVLKTWQFCIKGIAVHGVDFQQRDKHSRDTGFSKGGIPKFFDPQRGDTPGMEIFPTRGYFALKNTNFVILLKKGLNHTEKFKMLKFERF